MTPAAIIVKWIWALSRWDIGSMGPSGCGKKPAWKRPKLIHRSRVVHAEPSISYKLERTSGLKRVAEDAF